MCFSLDISSFPNPKQKYILRLTKLTFLSSGPSQFLLTNFILGSSPKNSKMKKELRRSMCLSSPGPHAILITFDLEKISPNNMKTPKLVKDQFGENVLNYTMILLVYDGHLRGRALNDEFMRSDWHLRELVEQCNCRYHVFSKNWRNRSGSRELLHKIERMRTVGGHHYINRSYKRAESVRNEERKLRKQRQSETERTCRELEAQFWRDELHWQMDAYNVRVRAEAELQNSWLRTSAGCYITKSHTQSARTLIY
uniref:AIG1-type G domain-containing protein n=1 Tax=Sinocyclocheilus anshuiensis TaxID=1608454 RepID=A0A671MMP8_9TELE